MFFSARHTGQTITFLISSIYLLGFLSNICAHPEQQKEYDSFLYVDFVADVSFIPSLTNEHPQVGQT